MVIEPCRDFVTTGVGEPGGLERGSRPRSTVQPQRRRRTKVGFISAPEVARGEPPVDTVGRLRVLAADEHPREPALRQAIATYQAAPAKTQSDWTGAYTTALAKATGGGNGSISVAAGNYGPVPTMMNALLGLAQSGGLDGALLTNSQFYQTDYTKPLLFMGDGGELAARAQQQHLLGTQWGMMNETGSYPGQVWLWLYTFWYQIKPFNSSPNADALVMMMMGVLSLALILIPFLPGVRDIPRWIPIYRYIWRDHYRDLRRDPSPR